MRGVKWFFIVVVPLVVVASVVVWWLMPRPVAGKPAPKSGVSRSQAVPKKHVTRPASDVRFEGVSDARVVEVEKKLLGGRFEGVRASAGDSALASRVLVDNWDCATLDECVPTAHGVGFTDEDTYNHEGARLMGLNGAEGKRLLDCRVFSQGGVDYMVGVLEMPAAGAVVSGTKIVYAFGGRVGVDELGEKVWFVDSDTFA